MSRIVRRRTSGQRRRPSSTQCDTLCIVFLLHLYHTPSTLRPKLLCFGSMQVLSHALPVLLSSTFFLSAQLGKPRFARRGVRTPPEYRRTTSAEPPLNCLTRDSIMVIHVNAISIQDATFTKVALRLQRTNTRPASGLVSEPRPNSQYLIHVPRQLFT